MDRMAVVEMIVGRTVFDQVWSIQAVPTRGEGSNYRSPDPAPPDTTMNRFVLVLSPSDPIVNTCLRELQHFKTPERHFLHLLAVPWRSAGRSSPGACTLFK